MKKLNVYLFLYIFVSVQNCLHHFVNLFVEGLGSSSYHVSQDAKRQQSNCGLQTAK